MLGGNNALPIREGLEELRQGIQRKVCTIA